MYVDGPWGCVASNEATKETEHRALRVGNDYQGELDLPMTADIQSMPEILGCLRYKGTRLRLWGSGVDIAELRTWQLPAPCAFFQGKNNQNCASTTPHASELLELTTT